MDIWPWGVTLLIVLVVVIVKVIGRVRQPDVETFDADAVAVIVHLARHARLKGDDSPQSVSIVVRDPRSGAEHRTPALRLERLPTVLRRQVYGQSLVINEFEPNLALPRAERADAIAQPRSGGYRFVLPQPVPMHCRLDDRGRLRCRPLR